MSKDRERSLKDKIKAIAKAENRSFNDLWQNVVLERFLARLSRSSKADHLIFKGGFLLAKYIKIGRETSDLDFSLVDTEGSIEAANKLIAEVVAAPIDDGFTFTGIGVEQMNHHHMDFPGYQVSALATFGQTRTTIRVDLGIGDRVNPEYKSIDLLSLNNKPLFESQISLRVYPLAYIFAEKLQAVVARGGTNSRMKDFYDLSLITVSDQRKARELARDSRLITRVPPRFEPSPSRQCTITPKSMKM